MADPRLNRLPPADDVCCVCYEEADRMMRCSTCRNMFYCSQKCQKKDWSKDKQPHKNAYTHAHKHPIEGQAHQDLEDEVHRVAEILQKWMDAYEPYLADTKNNDVWKTGGLPEDLLIRDIQLSSAYSSDTYKRVPEGHPTYAYRLPTTLIARLFLIHLATPSPTRTTSDLRKLENWLGAIPPFPNAPTKLWPPKLLCRPGELSPGEYDAVLSVLPVIGEADMDLDAEENPDEAKEAGAGKKMSEQRWKKVAFMSRYHNLAHISRMLFITE
ncbi:hypothetical protein EIP91_001278 [Steccherinum ochraceum]|uniref:MYND-type domain-containing protein n=1 Tax=Steccherinum ochraceum TaxID=92696 RepID=A0A4R0RH84_9APHY|nr:hypothetical protein EIP91_001278 [Steccherinum ochraceum]